MKKQTQHLQTMCVAALLCAVAILIPMVMPIKVVLEPMSFTLASHVAICIAMFISPWVGVAVNVGATIGFLFAIPSPVVWMRAASQTVFVLVGGLLLKKYPSIGQSFGKTLGLGVITGLLHAVMEVLVVSGFYLAGVQYQNQDNIFYMLFVLVGVGTFLHHLVDYYLALAVWAPVCRFVRFPIVLKLGLKADADTKSAQ